MENEMNPGNQQLSITVYHSGLHGNAQNCTYPYSGTGSTPEELKQLFFYGHTFIRFRNNYRSRGNFQEATVATLDNDNDNQMILTNGFPSMPFPNYSLEFPVWSAPAATT